MPETKTIRCLVVDDEPPAREIIRRYIDEVPTLECAGECANALQALVVLQQQQPLAMAMLEILVYLILHSMEYVGAQQKTQLWR